MNQSDDGRKRRILIGVGCAVFLVVGAIAAREWSRKPRLTFVPHVEPAQTGDEEEVVEELKVREPRERPRNKRDDGDTIREPKARKKKENKKIPVSQPVAGLP